MNVQQAPVSTNLSSALPAGGYAPQRPAPGPSLVKFNDGYALRSAQPALGQRQASPAPAAAEPAAKPVRPGSVDGRFTSGEAAHNAWEGVKEMGSAMVQQFKDHPIRTVALVAATGAAIYF